MEVGGFQCSDEIRLEDFSVCCIVKSVVDEYCKVMLSFVRLMIKRIFSVQSLEGYKQEMKRGYISKFGAPIAVNLMHADDGWPIDRFASSGNVFGLAVWLALYIFSTDPIIEETRMHIAFDLYSRACRSVFSSTGLASATCA